MQQKICFKELDRHLHKLRNGSKLVKIYPIDCGVPDHYCIDDMVISSVMGMDIAYYHMNASEPTKQDVKLVFGNKTVTAWVTNYQLR